MDDFAGDLVGLESLLQFHAFGVDAVLNKAAGGALVTRRCEVNWKTFSSTGLNISAAQAALSATSLGDLTSSVDVSVDGNVALNVLSGVLVAKGHFTIGLGQVRSADLPSGALQDADAMTLTLFERGRVRRCGRLAAGQQRRGGDAAELRGRHGGQRHARIRGDGGHADLGEHQGSGGECAAGHR
jgi:hypothetical protein